MMPPFIKQDDRNNAVCKDELALKGEVPLKRGCKSHHIASEIVPDEIPGRVIK